MRTTLTPIERAVEEAVRLTIQSMDAEIAALQAENARLSAALAEAKARGMLAGIERAAAYHDDSAVCEEIVKARRHRVYASDIRALATAAPAETE